MNYMKLEDSFMNMKTAKDEDGENVFGKPERSEDENSNPSDEESEATRRLSRSRQKRNLNYWFETAFSRKIAIHFGDKTTYDRIENRFRSLRKLAEILKEKVESDSRGSTNNSVSPSFTSNASNATPKKPRAKKEAGDETPSLKQEKVINGRVVKSGGTNKDVGSDGSDENGSENVINGIKEEIVSSDDSNFFRSDYCRLTL